MRPLLAVALLALLATTGCESTQARAARLATQGAAAFSEKGLDVKKANPDVRIGETTVLEDDNGTAVMAEVRNVSDRPMVDVPLEMDVIDRDPKRPVFQNNEPGLEPGLVQAAYLPPGGKLMWVHDEVYPSGGKARDVKITPGESRGKVPKDVPELDVGKPKLAEDPFDGLYLRGKVKNPSKVEQARVVIFGVARKGDRIVAVGRSGVERLPAGGSKLYRIFFIGNPRGASYEVQAPPTILE